MKAIPIPLVLLASLLVFQAAESAVGPAVVEQVLSLDGPWLLEPVGGKAREVTVPGFWERIQGLRDVHEATYRRDFDIPASFAGGRVFLKLNAVGDAAEVSVNGQHAGGHVGAALPFTVDITGLVTLPSTNNKLAVLVRDDSHFSIVSSGRGRRDRKHWISRGMGANNRKGLYQDVTLHAVPLVQVADVRITTSVRKQELGVHYEVFNGRKETISARLATFDRDYDALGPFPKPPTLTVGEATRRTLIVYNDAFSDEHVDVRWTANLDGKNIAGEIRALKILLGQEFDQHPQLEYVDVSGYGFWGEMHHIARYAPDGPRKDYIPGSPERAEVIMDRIIRDHLRAFPKTPAVLNLHAAEYQAGLRAFEEGQVWSRRDSFRYNFSTTEVRLAQGLKPGNGMVWEIIRPGIYCPVDGEIPTEKLYPIPQRYFDIAANYVAMGFNAWDAIWAHEHCLKTYEFIEQNIGYRIRPSIVWRRRLRNREEIVLGLRNDGCVGPPGQLTLQARFPDGRKTSTELPMGEPTPGAMKLYGLPLPADAAKYGSESRVELSMELQMKGKLITVRWAVPKWQAVDAFALKVLLKQVSA